MIKYKLLEFFFIIALINKNQGDNKIKGTINKYNTPKLKPADISELSALFLHIGHCAKVDDITNNKFMQIAIKAFNFIPQI